ncbi:MAG: hypothetical protein IPM74_12335 [Crocinitomicaceae bacterium]|nr:hypothetical protein [Crocinitomicaceae bacterium]MBK8926663.1 hypothetical protein [Crocinitomicaceae bacterium]
MSKGKSNDSGKGGEVIKEGRNIPVPPPASGNQSGNQSGSSSSEKGK